MSRSKRLLVLVLIAFVVAGILWAAARLYLSSEQVTTQVSSRLQALYGAPIQIRQADVGVLGSSLRDLRVFENKTSPADEPWLVIEHVEADVPLWDLAKKKALPSQVTLSGVAISLRFDKSGHLLTSIHIPNFGQTAEAFPRIKIDGGRITLRDSGRHQWTRVVGSATGPGKPQV